ncbi:hypothetical protein I2W78_29665 [Streptomyces spinoverrucosus]|uniref:hypothetical protein n=1 Tax=Streptomyces spinoverrucosus TaxID=284043 RepID=UPI0018C38175|nr:hypothetical protein [Streptomyces spinoverrucosus]MBG0855899.1 hypothetical protein [Streptomyces spinoverrucosus]
MKAPRARRLFAMSAIGVLLAGGAAIGTAGTASAATPTSTPANWGDDDWWDHRDRYGHYGFFDNYGFFDPYNRFSSGPVVIVVR